MHKLIRVPSAASTTSTHLQDEPEDMELNLFLTSSSSPPTSSQTSAVTTIIVNDLGVIVQEANAWVLGKVKNCSTQTL